MDHNNMDHASLKRSTPGPHSADHVESDHKSGGVTSDNNTMNHHANGHEHGSSDHGDAGPSVMDHASMGHGGRGGHSGHSEHSGDDGHGGHGDHVGQFRRLFWIMLVIAVPVAVLSPMFAMIIGYDLPNTAWIVWVSPVLGTVMYVWGGKPFLSGAVTELKAKQPGMMLLIALAITVAYVASLGATLGLLDHSLDFWWELALLIVIMLLGHWIEMRSLAQTSSALDSLSALLPDEAERIDGETVVTVSPSTLLVGDVVRVRPGARIPADGEVIDGTAEIDESMVTGESRTVSRGPGSRVVAGTVATDTAIRVRVTAVGDDTALAGIQRLVSDAQNSSSRAQRLADTAAGWLFWFALGAAAITAIVWTLAGNPDDAVIRTITVLVIACPHALGLAIPLVVSISTERAAKAGVLIKDRLALESMRNVDAVLFDKTGTLTEGAPVVTDVLTASSASASTHSAGSSGTNSPGASSSGAGSSGAGSFSAEQIIRLAGSAEADSEHPLAKAIVAAATEAGPLPAARNFRASAAVGVTATVEGHEVSVGGPHLLSKAGASPLAETTAWADEGAIILHVLIDGHVAGALRLDDNIRDESRDTVAELQRRGIEVIMITGDADAVARSVATQLGIDRVFSGVRPEDKASKVSSLQAEGRRVAMVGDGVNDAPALAQADVGLAIGAGTDVAIASAGVILASDDPRSVVSIIELSKRSYQKMKQNLWWAAGYNILSVPLAAGILAPIGFVLPMAVGALLMSASTVVVALNAQLLRRLDLRPERIMPHA